MQLLKHCLFIAFLLPLGLLAQEAETSTNDLNQVEENAQDLLPLGAIDQESTKTAKVCDEANWAKCGDRPAACCSGPANKAVLGVTIEDTDNGVKIQGISDDSGADQAGLRVNDLIKKVGKKEVADMYELIDALAPFKAGETVKIAYERDGKNKKAKVELKAREAKKSCAKGSTETNYKRFEQKENVQIIRLNDAEMDHLISGEEIKVIVSPVDEDGKSFSQEIAIQLEEGADPCPEFNVIITRLDEEEKEIVAENDRSVDMQKMTDLKVINLSLFPNPNSGKFELDFSLEENQPVTVRLVSLSGKEIYRERVTDFNGRYNNFIDISQNTAGVYVLQVMQNTQILTRKIVIEK